MNYTYKTSGTCSTSINFDINGDVISNVSFTGGCNGNLKAVSILVNNMTVSEIEEKFAGNTCGFRKTSCADQLAKAVRQALNEQN
ncbi:MAG: TIGR03905 family TSCPD domain-containing protein [Spirochaetaceae bacterium]|nr:TIGR03905 family TSCPD domain-containing protein [Spirochaetaceae bacterium]